MDINKISNQTIFRIMAIISAFIGLAASIYLVRQQLTWVGISFFLAVAINPAVEKLSRRMPRKSRASAAGIVFLLTIALLFIVGITLIPPLVSQTQTLVRDLPDLTNQLQSSDSPAAQLARRYNVVPLIKANQDKFSDGISNLGGSVLELVKSIFSSLVALLTILALTFFMLMEGPGWIKIIMSLQPPEKRAHREELAGKMYQAVTGYVTGNLFTSLIAAIATALALTIAGIPFAIPLGILVGIFDLLPLIGASLGAAIVVLVCLFTSFTAAVVMLIFFLLYQQLENHVLQPLVYSRTVQLSPLTVLVSALIGTSFGGLVGALVAIPIAASVQILLKDYMKRRKTPQTVGSATQ